MLVWFALSLLLLCNRGARQSQVKYSSPRHKVILHPYQTASPVTLNRPVLSTASRSGSQQNPPVLVQGRTHFSLGKCLTTQNLGCDHPSLLPHRTTQDCSCGNLYFSPAQYPVLLIANMWLHLYAFQSPLPLPKVKYTSFLHITYSLTTRSMPRAPNIQILPLKPPHNQLWNYQRKKKIKNEQSCFQFLNPSFSRSISQSSQEQTSFTMQKRHINPTGRRQSFEMDTKPGNKKIQPLSLVFATPTVFVQICA